MVGIRSLSSGDTEAHAPVASAMWWLIAGRAVFLKLTIQSVSYKHLTLPTVHPVQVAIGVVLFNDSL